MPVTERLTERMKPTGCGVVIRHVLRGVTATTLSLAAAGSLAQDGRAKTASSDERYSLVEIVVTAERRAQRAQDVPLALTTFSGDQIQPGAVADLKDIALKTPNFTLNQYNIAEPQLYLRGIGSTLDSAASDPTVSVFVDEVYIARPGASSFDLYDLDRIEVLRGPQGTLYGRNVTGGAVSVYTKAPAEQYEAKFGVTVGNYDLSVLRGYVSGPVSDTVRGKISFSRTDRDGYSRNIDNGQELDDAHNFSTRGQLLVDLSDQTRLTLGADLSRDRTNGDCRHITYFDKGDQAFNGAFNGVTIAALAQEGITGPRECGQKWVQFANRDTWGVNARLVHDMGWATLTSITGYRRNDFEWKQELTGMDVPPGPLSVADNEGEKSWQLTQELRLSGERERLDWVVGAFGFREDVDRFAKVPQRFSATSPILPNVLRDRHWTQAAKATSVAAFGQATWEFVPNLSLTVGGRYTYDKKEIDQWFWQSGVVVYDLKDLEKSWKRFTGRASLDWKITDDVMAYFTFSQGYKSGVFISQSIVPNPAATPLEPEKAENYEVGIRTEFLDNRVRVNVTAFDLNVRDLQLFRLVGFDLRSENTDAKVQGLEADIAVAPARGLTLGASLSVMDPKYSGGTFDGNRLARAQKTRLVLDGSYEYTMSNGAGLVFGASYTRSGRYFMESTNVDVSSVPVAELFDASIKYVGGSDRWDVTVWGRNLTDELIIRHSIVGAVGGSVQLYQPPRTFGATLNLRFD